MAVSDKVASVYAEALLGLAVILALATRARQPAPASLGAEERAVEVGDAAVETHDPLAARR